MLVRASGKCPEKGSLVVATLDYLEKNHLPRATPHWMEYSISLMARRENVSWQLFLPPVYHFG